MFDFLDPYRRIIQVVVICAAVAAAGYAWWRFLDYEQQIGWDRRDAIAVQDTLTAKNASDEELRRANHRVNESVLQGEKRARELQKTVAANVAVAGRLRDTIEAMRPGKFSIPDAAANQRINALANVFGECTDRLIEMAEHADGHASDTRTLIDAWAVSAVDQESRKIGD